MSYYVILVKKIDFCSPVAQVYQTRTDVIFGITLVFSILSIFGRI